MPSPTEITVAQLSRLIGLPDAPALVDVRTDEDFTADPHLIPGAFRHPFAEAAALACAAPFRPTSSTTPWMPRPSGAAMTSDPTSLPFPVG